MDFEVLDASPVWSSGGLLCDLALFVVQVGILVPGMDPCGLDIKLYKK